MATRTLQRVINSRVLKAFIPTAYISSVLSVADCRKEDVEEEFLDEKSTEPVNAELWRNCDEKTILCASDSIRQSRTVTFDDDDDEERNDEDWYDSSSNDDDDLEPFSNFELADETLSSFRSKPQKRHIRQYLGMQATAEINIAHTTKKTEHKTVCTTQNDISGRICTGFSLQITRHGSPSCVSGLV